jgi:hypothetical protein
LEAAYAGIQESSVEMIRECFDFVTERLGGSQITGIRGKDDSVAESFFSGSKSFGIASGDDDLRALGAQELGGGQADPASSASDKNGFEVHLIKIVRSEVIEIIFIKVPPTFFLSIGPARCTINISKSTKSVQNAGSSRVTAFMVE